MVPLNYRLFKRQNRQNIPQALIENGSIYVTKKKIYKINKNRLGGKISEYIMENYSVLEVDKKSDLSFFSALLKPEIRKIFKIINPKKIK